MYNTKVSIIVPVYNVEKYLKRCVDSLLNQTHENIEVILVDDESPDNCGIICDEYAKKDSRIKVIHKKNGGLSSARNAGLEIATGDYILYVDSDDWISIDTLELLKKYMLEDYDVISFKCEYMKEEKIVNIGKANEKKCDSVEFMTKTFERKIDFFVWNKLYKNTIFKEIRFPEGKNYEDLGTMDKIYYTAKKFLITEYCLYYYWLENPNSITKNHTLKNMEDYLWAIKQMYKNSSRLFEENNKSNNIVIAWYKQMLIQLYINYIKSSYKDEYLLTRIKKELKETNVKVMDMYKQGDFIKYILYKMGLLPYVIKIIY